MQPYCAIKEKHLTEFPHQSESINGSTEETHHSFRSVDAVVVSSLAAARTILLVLLAVLLLLLFLCRCRAALSALCGRRGRGVKPGDHRCYNSENERKSLTRWVFEDERAEFVFGVEHAAVSTGLTGSTNGLFLGIDMLPETNRTFL